MKNGGSKKFNSSQSNGLICLSTNLLEVKRPRIDYINFMDSSVLFALAFKPTKSECCIVLLRTTARQGYRFIGCKSLLISLLLMISGDIETNPGPKCHFSCVSCSKAIRNSENSIGCTKCRKWTHLGCSALSYEEFQSLSDREWLCCACLQSYLPHSLLKDLTTDQKLYCLDNSLLRPVGSVHNTSHSESFEVNSSISFCVAFQSMPTMDERATSRNVSNSKFQIVHLNIRSLLHHIDELRHFAVQSEPDIIVLSETWIDYTIMDNEVLIEGYSVHRKDHNHQGGGIAILACDYLCTKPFSASNGLNTSTESIWLEVSYKTFPSILLLGCCYRRPSSPPISVDHFFSEVETALSHKKNVVVCGDLNINLSGGNHSFKDKLLNFINSHSLYQPINLPTRITRTTSSLLDIFLVSDQGLAECAGVSDLAIADHMMIYLRLSWKRLKIKAALTCKIHFSKFDELDFCYDLNKCPWSIINTFDSPDDKLDIIYRDI